MAFMYVKRQISLTDDMELEVYISSKLPNVLDQEDISALVIFLRLYFSDRRQYRIISCIFGIEYEYLYGAFTPHCSYDKFLGIVNSLKFFKSEFQLDSSFSSLPTKDEEKYINKNTIELINIINAPRDEKVIIGSDVFYAITKSVTEIKGEGKTIPTLRSLFGWHEHIIRYFIENRQNSL